MLAVADKAEAFITDSPDAELEERSAAREAIKTTLPEPADTPDQAAMINLASVLLNLDTALTK